MSLEEACGAVIYNLLLRSRSALPTTDAELRLIASAAIIGESSQPVKGYSTPAATGTPRPLYKKANNRFSFILRTVASDNLRAVAIPRKSPLTSVICALLIATSVPVPIAMPTSALASAGASLMPSPAIATTRPSF